MLVLCRSTDQKIVIGDEIELTVVNIEHGRVKIGIDAPNNVTIHRKEVYDKIKREKYQEWYNRVNQIVTDLVGMPCSSLPDFPSREYYDKGMSAEEGAEAGLAYGNIEFRKES